MLFVIGHICDRINSQRETRQEVETRDHGQETLDNVEPLSLIQSYFNSKFKSFKRQLAQESDEDSKKTICQHREFKFKSNQMQFEFNSGITGRIEEVTKLLETRAQLNSFHFKIPLHANVIKTITTNYKATNYNKKYKLTK